MECKAFSLSNGQKLQAFKPSQFLDFLLQIITGTRRRGKEQVWHQLKIEQWDFSCLCYSFSSSLLFGLFIGQAFNQTSTNRKEVDIYYLLSLSKGPPIKRTCMNLHLLLLAPMKYVDGNHSGAKREAMMLRYFFIKMPSS